MTRHSERRIFIRDFRLQVSIGIHDFEKEGPQTVVVNVDLLLEPGSAAHGDRIANVLNYDVVHDGRVVERQAWSYEKPGLTMKAVGHWFGFWDEVEVVA